MFKISNTQKVILDILGERHEILLNCNTGLKLNTIDADLASTLNMKVIKPRLMNIDGEPIPTSNVEFTLEVTSLDGEVKRITGVADVAYHLRKDQGAIRAGSNLLKELEACIIM
jgi:hypothetical protein